MNFKVPNTSDIVCMAYKKLLVIVPTIVDTFGLYNLKGISNYIYLMCFIDLHMDINPYIL